MADDVVLPGSGLAVAADDISSKYYQRIKLVHGIDGVNDGDVSTINPFPIMTQLIDELGAKYGIKHILNKPRVSAMPYSYDIAEGNVPNHDNFRKLGYNGSVGTALEDITTLSNVINIPSVAAIAEVVSSNAADAGTVIYDSQATGGSASTLIDTGQDFTAGNVVVVGDLILLDDDTEFGVVSNVTVTVLSVSPVFSGGVSVNNLDNYRIIDKSAGGTGIQVVKICGLDSSYVHLCEYVVLNGVTEVATVNSFLRFNNFSSYCVGSSGAAVGNVNLRHVTDTPIYSQIAIGNNDDLTCLYTVESGKTLYITDWDVGGGAIVGSGSAQLILRANVDFNSRELLPVGLFQSQDISLSKNSPVHKVYPLPLKFPETTDIKVSAISTSGSVQASSSFGFWIEQ